MHAKKLIEVMNLVVGQSEITYIELKDGEYTWKELDANIEDFRKIVAGWEVYLGKDITFDKLVIDMVEECNAEYKMRVHDDFIGNLIQENALIEERVKDKIVK